MSLERCSHALNRIVATLSLLLCVAVLAMWAAGTRADNHSPFWMHATAPGGRAQYAIGSLDGQMELRRTRLDDHPLPGPHCGERAACAAFERQFPPAIRHEYLGCAIGHEPVIDVFGHDEQLVKTGTAWFVIVPNGLSAFLFGIFPTSQALRFLARRPRQHPRYR